MLLNAQQKTYLITGAAGFIGTRFVESCNYLGIHPISVDREEYFSTRTENRNVFFGKIVDLNFLLSWLETHRPKIDAIVHLGAVTDTRESDWTLLQKLNLDYSKALWNYAQKAQIPFVYASSAATYGDGQLGYDDREELIPNLRPLNAYGESKQLFDLWALEQEKKGEHPPYWSGFKFFNVYGYGERHKEFMSSVVLHAFDQIQKGEGVTLFKSHKEGIPDGHQMRDFVFVEDVVKALHFAAEKPIRRGIYNLGSGKARTFLDLAKAVFQSLGKEEKIHFIDTPLSIREKYQYFTEAKMTRLVNEGFEQPFTPLESGVRRYIEKLLAVEKS